MGLHLGFVPWRQDASSSSYLKKFQNDTQRWMPLSERWTANIFFAIEHNHHTMEYDLTFVQLTKFECKNSPHAVWMKEKDLRSEADVFLPHTAERECDKVDWKQPSHCKYGSQYKSAEPHKWSILNRSWILRNIVFDDCKTKDPIGNWTNNVAPDHHAAKDSDSDIDFWNLILPWSRKHSGKVLVPFVSK